jgi:Ribbon-helix-helix protein, copG family
MRADEREEYGEEARDVIEGLRRLAHRSETPPGLRSTILAQGERLLPPQKRHLARWWTVIGAWRPHPLAWGPVVAGAFFIAGVLTPWPRAGVSLHDTVSEKSSAPATQSLSKESTEDRLVPPMMPTLPPRQEMWQQIESAPAPRESYSVLARHAPAQVSASSQTTVTATLPTDLFELLQHEAQRRRVSIATILREAVEAYTLSQKRED